MAIIARMDYRVEAQFTAEVRFRCHPELVENLKQMALAEGKKYQSLARELVFQSVQSWQSKQKGTESSSIGSKTRGTGTAEIAAMVEGQKKVIHRMKKHGQKSGLEKR